jgi:hypothetical protein
MPLTVIVISAMTIVTHLRKMLNIDLQTRRIIMSSSLKKH